MSKTTIKNLILAVLVLIVTFGSFMFMLYQIDKKSSLLKTQIDTASTQSAQEYTLLNLEKIANATQAEREKVSGYFLRQESESINFLSLVEQKAPQVGVKLQTESLKKSVDATTKAEWIEVDFLLSGTLRNVQEFIKLLENVPYVSQLLAVDLTMVSSNQWQAKVKIKVFIMAYDS